MTSKPEDSNTIKVLVSKKLMNVKESGCIEWMGHKNALGYGVLGASKTKIYIHRLMWSLFRGRITKNLCICHKCDNPPCINPDHLFIGTHKDNMADMNRKGRSRRYKFPPRIKYSDSLVKKMRKDYDNGMAIKEIIRKYGIKYTQAYRIVKRKVRI